MNTSLTNTVSKMPAITAAIIAIGALLFATSARADELLKNGDFENGQLAPWLAPKPSTDDGWNATIAEEGAGKSLRSAMISHSGDGAPTAFGNLLQSVPVEGMRGKRIRLTAQVKHGGAAGTTSQLWLRVDRPAGKMGFFDNCADRPVTRNEWQTVEITGDIADDATGVIFGLMSLGKGSRSMLDEVRLEVLASLPAAIAGAALTERELANVVAFVRLAGYVRYFHPSAQAAAMKDVDWNHFLVDGIGKVESAADALALADGLGKLFAGIAPKVAIEAGDKLASVPEQPSIPAYSWEHNGFGFSTMRSVYSSKRTRSLVTKKPWVASLGGGVMCAVPLTDFGSDAVNPPAENTRVAYTPRDRAARLATVSAAWNVMQHFHPYIDESWLAQLPNFLQAAATAQDDETLNRVVQTLGAALKDGHCYVNGPGAHWLDTPPVRLEWAEGKLCVAQSRQPGLEPGDAILEIDGKPLADVMEEKLAVKSSPSPHGSQLTAARSVLNGPRGSNVRILIEPYTAPHTPREVIAQRNLNGKRDLSPKRERRKELAPGILYIDLDQWTGAEFEAAWTDLAKAKGIIFEHRNYPNRINAMSFFGHFSADSVTSAKFCTPRITLPDRTSIEYPTNGGWTLRPREPQLKCPVAFLIDASCISYAESCLSIVEHHKLGDLVGSPTIGTNGNIVTAPLPCGFAITFTGMKVIKQDGTPHHGIGILPTVPAVPTRKGLAEGRDEVIEAALARVIARTH